MHRRDSIQMMICMIWFVAVFFRRKELAITITITITIKSRTSPPIFEIAKPLIYVYLPSDSKLREATWFLYFLITVLN